MANSIFQNFIQVFRTPTAFVDTYPGFLVQSELDERFGLKATVEPRVTCPEKPIGEQEIDSLLDRVRDDFVSHD